MRAGPKRAISVPPLDLSHLGRTRAARAIRFIEEFCVTPKGKGALKPVRLRPWQKAIIRKVLGSGVRQGLVSIPRGNGKSTLAAFLALWGLFDGPQGAQVLTVASDERQARIIFDAARRMIELNPLLAEQVQIFHDRLYLPYNDGTITPLPADPSSLQGWDPTLAIVDELHVVREETWEAISLAAGKRDESLTLAVSTPATQRDSVMWRLVEHGRAEDDPGFVLVEYAAPDGCLAHDEKAWKQANPALGDFLALDALRATYRTTREGAFRQFRLGQWVGRAEGWLPWGLWDSRADTEKQVPKGTRIVAGFDGSASGDSTALVGATVEAHPHLFLIGIWENDQKGWRVNRSDVDAAVQKMFRDYDVVEMACDPWGWRSEIQLWSEKHGARKVIEWPTNVFSRMAPATDRTFTMLAEGRMTHDGSEELSAHFSNCIAKRTSLGDVIVKDQKSSPRKIDAAVAGIVAVDRAIFHHERPRKRRLVVA